MENWFEVDKKGLRALQEGKNKTFILRELIQNAFDEDITFCKVNISWNNGMTTLSVEDDNPVGFRDLTHAYTLYADTYKRKDTSKRGRFNLGEKQALSICTYASIITTKGNIIFDKDGRKKTAKKRKSGSSILMMFKSTKREYEELIDYGRMILIPKGVVLFINDEIYKYTEPFKTFNARLRTEIDTDGVLRGTFRFTDVHVHKKDYGEEAYLYELGIPICEIECDYSLDVQQKIPLSTDREKVSAAFLKELYTEVLNVTFDEISEENASSTWVRVATTGKNISENAIKSVIQNRFGNKVVVANPGDRNSIDDAISNNYNVIYGSEMNKDEWENVRKFQAIESSSKLFGSTATNDYKIVEPDYNQQKISDWIIKMTKEMLRIDISIRFITSKAVTHIAEYGYKTLTFNLTKIPKHYWDLKDNTVCVDLLDLIIHEVSHEHGMHYEKSYHECITKLGAKLVWKMKENPKWFKV